MIGKVSGGPLKSPGLLDKALVERIQREGWGSRGQPGRERELSREERWGETWHLLRERDLKK